jgi:hypothetical protein
MGTIDVPSRNTLIWLVKGTGERQDQYSVGKEGTSFLYLVRVRGNRGTLSPTLCGNEGTLSIFG